MAHFRDAAPQLPAILVEHDITFTLYRQYGKRERGEYRRWLAFERKWLRAYDAVWTMSDEDRRAAASEGVAAESTFVVPNGVDFERFVPIRTTPAGPPSVLFIGSFRHRPNVIAFEKLRKEVMPRVWGRFSKARLHVVAGPNAQRYWRARSLDARIDLTGFVPDLRPLYAGADVVAVPLVVSAGTNIKVMEAMACGKPVVTTTPGCAGLRLTDGLDAIIRDDAAAFAGAICDLLADPELRAGIAANARETAQRSFGWHAAARRAWESYEVQLSRAMTRAN